MRPNAITEFRIRLTVSPSEFSLAVWLFFLSLVPLEWLGWQTRESDTRVCCVEIDAAGHLGPVTATICQFDNSSSSQIDHRATRLDILIEKKKIIAESSVMQWIPMWATCRSGIVWHFLQLIGDSSRFLVNITYCIGLFDVPRDWCRDDWLASIIGR